MKNRHEIRYKIWTASQVAQSEIRDMIALQVDVNIQDLISVRINNIGSDQVNTIRWWTAYDRKGFSRNLTQG